MRCRTFCQNQDACVHLDSRGNIAKMALVPVTAPPVCMEDNVWRKMEGPSPATVQWDIQESSVRLEN